MHSLVVVRVGIFQSSSRILGSFSYAWKIEFNLASVLLYLFSQTSRRSPSDLHPLVFSLVVQKPVVGGGGGWWLVVVVGGTSQSTKAALPSQLALAPHNLTAQQVKH